MEIGKSSKIKLYNDFATLNIGQIIQSSLKALP